MHLLLAQGFEPFGELTGPGLALVLLILALVLGLTVFWVWMLIDVLRGEEIELRRGEKLTWVLVVVLLGLLGAVLYWFLARPYSRRKLVRLERRAAGQEGGDDSGSGDTARTGPVSRQSTGPSRVWYWVAGVAVAASVVWLAAGIFFGIRSLSRQVEGFQRVPIPGQAELRFDGQVAIPSLSVSLAPVGGGAEVPVYPYGGSATYSVGGRSGRAVGTFRIDAPGRFLIRTQGNPEGGQAEVAVGPSIAPWIGRTLGLTLPPVLVLFFGGVALAVVVAALRG
jgi:hypothetical protein